MSQTAQAILGSWSIDPLLALGSIAIVLVYLRGWRALHRVHPARFPAWRAVAFAGGVTALWLAIASPLDAFGSLLLAAHMVQHLLLMSAAPPLILLGAPALPLLCGLPRAFARDGLGPFLAWRPLRRGAHLLTHPVACWLAMAASLCAWHVPGPFALALLSPSWHRLEHLCFLSTSLLFWWPVVRPFPSRPHWPLWSVPLYLLAADVLNTALAAILTFSEHVLYPTYATAPRLPGTTALGDQITAGVIMWVPGSLAFLVPAVAIAIRCLSPTGALVRPRGAKPATVARRRPPVSTAAPRAPLDLLALPMIGPWLRSRASRLALQAALLVVAAAVVADGMLAPRSSATNLAGVLPWTYWRAAVVVLLLAAGNFFCMACPFTLPRALARRLGVASHAWPRALRSKWLAIALLVLFFWASEAFALWDSPLATAWIVVAYFLASFAVDALFRGASFCKYVCPIGQFQFIASLVSPLEVKARSLDVCTRCRTHDCLHGNDRRPGCETDLFVPRKAGNLDCTFCLDCARACPHDNVGLQLVAPGADLVRDPRRSSLGRLARRWDIAALALVLVFAAFAAAAAMVSPVGGWRDRLVARAGGSSPAAVDGLLFALALVVAPAVALSAAVLGGRAAAHVTTARRELLCRFALALVPLGTAMWAAHSLFHLLAGYATAWPVLQRAAGDLHAGLLGAPDWSLSRLRFDGDSILALQTLVLDVGLLLTLHVGWRIARRCAPHARAALALLAPWALVAIALYASGIWIFLQPMQMRGLMMPPM
jgi:cytochrome c oxidase assembly factor CtaG